MTIQEAIDAPSISGGGGGGTISFVTGIDANAKSALEALGHAFRDAATDIGSVQTVVVHPATGLQYGGADSRRVGAVRGLPVTEQESEPCALPCLCEQAGRGWPRVRAAVGSSG